MMKQWFNYFLFILLMLVGYEVVMWAEDILSFLNISLEAKEWCVILAIFIQLSCLLLFCQLSYEFIFEQFKLGNYWTIFFFLLFIGLVFFFFFLV